MPHNDAPQSRLLAVRSLLAAPARRVLGLLFARIPAPQQRLAAAALQAAAARWPQLSRLVGLVAESVPRPEASPPAPTLRVVRPADASKGVDPPPATLTQPVAAPARSSPQPQPRFYVAQLRDAVDYADRVRAAAALGRKIDPEATAALVAALRDSSSEVAAQAAEALGQHKGEVATSALRAVVENADGFFNPITRASAVRSLGTLLPRNEGTPIVSAVSDVDALVSLAAIAALAERDESASAGALMGVLENRAGFYLPLTRQAAARALMRLQNYEPERLRRLLESESDGSVREALSSLSN